MPNDFIKDVEDFQEIEDNLKEEDDVQEPDTDTETETAQEADTDTDTDGGEGTDPLMQLYEELELNKHYPGGVEAALKSIPEHRRHNETLRREMQEREERLRQIEQDNREMLKAMQQLRPQETVDFDDDPRQYIDKNYVPMNVAQDMYQYMLDMERRLNEVYNQTGEVKFASQYKDFDQVKDRVYEEIQSDPYLRQMPREKALEYAYYKVRPASQPTQPRPVAPADQQKKQLAQTTAGKGGRQPAKPQSFMDAWNNLDLDDWERKYGEPQ